MRGLHLTADLDGCDVSAPPMRDVEALRALCLAATRGAGLTPVGECFHAFGAPGGVTGVVLLAESHLAVHTWPELRAATIDVFVCNRKRANDARAEAVLAHVLGAFGARAVRRQRLRRGIAVAVAT